MAHGAQPAKSVDTPSTNGVTARYRIMAMRRPAAHALCIVSSGEWCEKKLRRLMDAAFVCGATTQATAGPHTPCERQQSHMHVGGRGGLQGWIQPRVARFTVWLGLRVGLSEARFTDTDAACGVSTLLHHTHSKSSLSLCKDMLMRT